MQRQTVLYIAAQLNPKEDWCILKHNVVQGRLKIQPISFAILHTESNHTNIPALILLCNIPNIESGNTYTKQRMGIQLQIFLMIFHQPNHPT